MVFAGLLAHRHARRVAPRQGHDVIADQAVVHDHVGLVQRPQRLERQEAGVPGPAPTSTTLPRRGGAGPGRRPARPRPGPAAAGAAARPRGRPAASRRSGAGRPGRVAGADALAVALGQSGQLAQCVVEQRFDAFAQAAGQHRGHARGRDRHDHRRAVHDGRHLERGQRRIVHHIAEQAAGLGGLGYLAVDLGVVGGGHDQPDGVQPGGVEPARMVTDAAVGGQRGQGGRQPGAPTVTAAPASSSASVLRSARRRPRPARGGRSDRRTGERASWNKPAPGWPGKCQSIIGMGFHPHNFDLLNPYIQNLLTLSPGPAID